MRTRTTLAMILAGLLVFAGGQETPVAAEDGPRYMGPESCKKCHFKQHKSWTKTSMAKTFEVLQPGEREEAKVLAGLDPAKDYTTDADCLPCHTTGYGEPGGFVSIAETPEMAGVSCDACHGPSEHYLEIKSIKIKDHAIKDMTDLGMVYPSTAKQCLVCHGDESPFNASLDEKYAFDFDERVQSKEGAHKHAKLKGAHPDLKDLGTLFQD